MNNNLEILKNNSVFWSKLGYCYDPPRMDNDGKQILFASDFGHFKRIQKDFTDAGIKVVSSIIPSGWIGIDQYDYELTDKILEAVCSASPDAYYIPRIKLNVPIEWCRENPEDVFVYYNGPRDVEKIKSLVGTEQHDILGYDSIHGYQNTFGYTDDRPNVNGTIALQSFSSKKWLKDAGEALLGVVQRIEQSKYADRILAYHIAYGVCGETCVWGRFRKNQLGDWGINNRKAFFDWGLKRYGSLDQLRKVWNSSELYQDNAEPPAPEVRRGSSSFEELMRSDKFGAICRDYELFSSDINVDAMEYFSRIVKENSGNKPVGYFYGYVLECDNAGYSGWLGYDRISESPYIDFIAAPKSYYRKEPGEPGGFLGAAQSVSLNKIWLDEIDHPTHLVSGASCRTFKDTRSVLWREFSKNMAAGTNFWWMDLGGGWYDSPDLMKEISAIEKAAKEIRKYPHKSVADVLLVIDENSLAQVNYGTSLHHLCCKEIIREFNLTGGIVDVFRLSDLENINLSQYRLIVNLNTFSLTCNQWRKISKKISETSVVMWNYASGIISNGFSFENIKKLTGFKVIQRDLKGSEKIVFDNLPYADCNSIYNDHPFPLLNVIPEENHNIVGKYTDGEAALVIDKQSVYCAFPILKSVHLRYIMTYAGCQFYGKDQSIIYGDNRFIAIFNGNSFSFKLKHPLSHDC